MLTLATDFLIECKSLIEKRLDELVSVQKEGMKRFFSPLFEGARYSLLAEAKRIRPLLALATYKTYDGESNSALDPACALELIHTYSLVHDDLPAMDNDDFRRGIPTLHKKANEATAILVGDYLLTYAFEVIASSSFSEKARLEMIRLLSFSAGGSGMIGGQIMDVEMTQKPLNLQELEFLHLHKTGALIKTSILFGAIMADVDEKQKALLALCGEKLGLLFQIVDDILDVTHSKQKHGKEKSTDEEHGKTTYPLLLGLSGAKERAQALYNSLSETLTKLDKDSTLLQEVAHKVISQIYSRFS